MRFISTLLYPLAGLLSASHISFADVRVADDLGRQLSLPEPAQRIVSLAPHNTENLFTAGAGDLVVGTVDHSDFPEQALAITRVGNYKQANFESIIKLRPDLIVAWSSGNPDSLGQRLEKLGFPVFYSEPTTYERIISNIERFGQLTDREQAARQAAHEMRELLNLLKTAYSGQSPVTIFYQVWDQPMITLNGQHSVSRALEICGGTNVFADEPTIAPRINVEGVISRNPQLILLAGHENAQTAGWREKWNNWPAIQAVANGQVRYVNPDIINRPTRRFLEGTRDICELINQVRKQE